MNPESTESSALSSVTTGTISTAPAKVYVNVDPSSLVSLANFTSGCVVTTIPTLTNTGRLPTISNQATVRIPGQFFLRPSGNGTIGTATGSTANLSSSQNSSVSDTVTFSISNSGILNSKIVEQRSKINTTGCVTVTGTNATGSCVATASSTITNAGGQRASNKKFYKFLNLPIGKNVNVSNTTGSTESPRIIVRTPFINKTTTGTVNVNPTSTGNAVGSGNVKGEKITFQRFPLQGNPILSLNTVGITQLPTGQTIAIPVQQVSSDGQGQPQSQQGVPSQVHVVQAQLVPQSQIQQQAPTRQITATVLATNHNSQSSQQAQLQQGPTTQRTVQSSQQSQQVQIQQVHRQISQVPRQQQQQQQTQQISQQPLSQQAQQISTQIQSQTPQQQQSQSVQKKVPAFEVRQTIIKQAQGVKRNYSRATSVGSTSPAEQTQTKRIKRNSISSTITPRSTPKSRKNFAQSTPPTSQPSHISVSGTLSGNCVAVKSQSISPQSLLKSGTLDNQQQSLHIGSLGQQQHHIKFQPHPQSQVLPTQVIHQQLQHTSQQIQHGSQTIQQLQHSSPQLTHSQSGNQTTLVPHLLLNTSTGTEAFQNASTHPQTGTGTVQQGSNAVIQSNVSANSILISQLLNKIPQVSGTDCKNGVITLNATTSGSGVGGSLTTMAPTFLVQMNPTTSTSNTNVGQTSGSTGVQMSQIVKKPQMLVKVPQKLDRKRAQKDVLSQQQHVAGSGKNFTMFNVSQGKPAAFSIHSNKNSLPVKSQEEIISEQIKILDNSIKVSLTNSSIVKNLHTTTPPVWWLVFEKYANDRCAPLSAFRNFPLAKEFCEYVNTNVCFEIQLLDDTCQEQNNYFSRTNNSLLNGNFSGSDLHNILQGLSKTKTPSPLKKKSECDGPAYWFVKIVDNCGIYFKLRYIGFENNSRYDFWINLRTRNLYPIGYAKSNCYKMRLPKEIEEFALETYPDSVKTMIDTCRNIRTDLLTRFTEQIQLPWIKVGLKLEALDKQRNSCFRPATIDNLIGDRIHVRFDGTQTSPNVSLLNENERDQGLWAHLQGGQLRPVGWAQLVGHELYASEVYAKKSLDRAFSNIKQLWNNNNFDVTDWGLFTRLEKFNDSNSFREGFKLEVIDPFNQLSICPATIRKVLRFNFLLLSLDSFQNEHSDSSIIFIVHASSPYILPTGFASTYSIHLQTPPGYNHKFDWTEYCHYTDSTPAPINLFISLDYSDNMFTEGMLLEAVDSLEPNLICNAVVKRVVGHLLLIHYIGWEDSMDQWVDFRSPNLFPVGYCDLIQYPLQGPPGKDSGATPKKDQKIKRSNSCKKSRKNSLNSPDELMNLSDGPTDTPMSLTEEKKNLTLIDLLSTTKDITDHYPIANNQDLNVRFTSNQLKTEENIEHRLKTLEQFNFTANMTIMSDVEESKNQENTCFNSFQELTNNKENVKTLPIYIEKDKMLELGRIKSYEDWNFYSEMNNNMQINGFLKRHDELEPFDIFSIPEESVGWNWDLRFNNFNVETNNFKSIDSSSITAICTPESENLDYAKASIWTEFEVAAYLKENVQNSFYLQNIIDFKINGTRILSLNKSGALKITKGVLSEAMRLLYHCDRLKIRVNRAKQ